MTTKAKVENESPVESTIYNRIREQAFTTGIVSRNDTIPLMEVAVKCTPGLSTPDSVGQYGVAVAQFKQIFNAKSMMMRLRNHGFYGATVVQNGEPLYYVLIFSGDDMDSAIEEYRKISGNSDFSFKPPYPTVFKPTIYPLAK
ncbi:MAG: SPOR domain-containing protein [Muribaculum sp.]|nr:SPOR domain-containing protein [Muribaculaceae bacterium]MCM1081027.1 SPOR domain-containing protein [Muribaculum sp.]